MGKRDEGGKHKHRRDSTDAHGFAEVPFVEVLGPVSSSGGKAAGMFAPGSRVWVK